MTDTARDARICLSSRINFENAADYSVELSKTLKENEEVKIAEHILIDAGSVTVFDSSILAVLLQSWRDAAQMNKTLKVINMSPQLQELSKLYGVEYLLVLQD